MGSECCVWQQIPHQSKRSKPSRSSPMIKVTFHLSSQMDHGCTHALLRVLVVYETRRSGLSHALRAQTNCTRALATCRTGGSAQACALCGGKPQLAAQMHTLSAKQHSNIRCRRSAIRRASCRRLSSACRSHQSGPSPRYASGPCTTHAAAPLQQTNTGPSLREQAHQSPGN